MKALMLLALALAAFAGPPTKIPIEQLKPPKSQAAMVLVSVQGKLQWVEFDNTVAIKDGKLTAIAYAPVTTIVAAPVLLTRAPDGTYESVENALIWRNGVMMLLGEDYQIFGGRVMPVEPWSAEDTVVAQRVLINPK